MLENQRSTAARAIQNLSEQKKTGVGRPDPSTRSAKLVAASTLAEFIPEKGLLKTTPDDVWELPCSMILDITASGGISGRMWAALFATSEMLPAAMEGQPALATLDFCT